MLALFLTFPLVARALMAQRLDKGDARWLEMKLEGLNVEMQLEQVFRVLQQGSCLLRALGPVVRPLGLFRVVRPSWVPTSAQSPRIHGPSAWVPGAR